MSVLDFAYYSNVTIFVLNFAMYLRRSCSVKGGRDWLASPLYSLLTCVCLFTILFTTKVIKLESKQFKKKKNVPKTNGFYQN